VRGEGDGHGSAPSHRGGMRKRKILLVDDSEISREMVRYILETRGFEVVALDTPFGFSTALNKERPDLALIDVDMPALSGDQLVRLSRLSGRAPCPLVLFSERQPEELRELVRASGADGYIAKTGDGEQLVTHVEYFLRLGSPSRDAEPPSSRSGDAPPPSSRRLPDSQTRGETSSGPAGGRRLSGSFDASGAPSSRRVGASFDTSTGPLSSRRLSGSFDATAPPSSSEAKPPKRAGSGLYQAVVAALEIPPPSTRRSGLTTSPGGTGPTPPAPLARELPPRDPSPRDPSRDLGSREPDARDPAARDPASREPAPPRRPTRTKTLS